MKLIAKLGCLGFLAFWGLLFAVVMAVAGGNSGMDPSSPAMTGSLLWPVQGTITDRFGPRTNPFPPYNEENHWGVDIGADAGTPVMAATDGEIVSATWAGGYGNLVILLGPDRLVTYYGHLSGFAAQRGQTVTKGQLIGYVGETGRAKGAHLHFEVRPNGGNPVDPLQYWGAMTSEQFVAKLAPFAAMAAAQLEVPDDYAAVFLVHWAQESGYESPEWIGRNGAAFNYAGIRIDGAWRSYDSMEAFVDEYTRVLQTTRLGGQQAYAEVIELMRAGAPIGDVLDALGRSPWDEDHYGRSAGLPDGTLLRRRHQEQAPWL
ncbi:MAG TPA: M23 family metallopeptidase [Symbiobacteriaceae bacterium]|nr:M23 family metallopeptidase [Symbiobacteriaceae bacterium]